MDVWERIFTSSSSNYYNIESASIFPYIFYRLTHKWFATAAISTQPTGSNRRNHDAEAETQSDILGIINDFASYDYKCVMRIKCKRLCARGLSSIIVLQNNERAYLLLLHDESGRLKQRHKG